ncbi:hypothetical protein BaRGS_00019932 [Batillaria attramentaria]|uniref:NSFL1 cofactor p47 n=1 Tax=Batillaria attramentaria TaxID=370345 RepID=A0ABD0KNU6_9CAEN
MADKDDVIEQFANVTGVDRSRAQFHLEAAAWNLELAMANYYEEGEHGVDDGSAAHPVDVDKMEDEEAPQLIGSAREASGRAPKPNSKFATIGSLRDNDGDSSSSEEGQAFYAGGSERSGQQVLGPSKKKKNPDALVSDLFKSAREHGAEELDRMSEQQPAGRSAFQGTGYRLGETEDASETIAGPSLGRSRPQVDMVLKMWKNGFSVDNGPLRPYDDPANKDFLDSIRRGEVPNELIHLAKGGEVNLNMEDHRQEDYVKPKVTVKAFSGEGNMLGSPAPAVVTKPASSGAAASASQVNIDSSQPVTTIQIRLADGQRMVEKFNLTHTVGDIRTHIIITHPQYASTPFVLMTTFPNKELTADSETLQEAKLANAVIVQKLK